MLKNANVKKCWEILKNVKRDEQDTEFLPYFPLICFPYFIILFIPFFLFLFPIPHTYPQSKHCLRQMYLRSKHPADVLK